MIPAAFLPLWQELALFLLFLSHDSNTGLAKRRQGVGGHGGAMDHHLGILQELVEGLPLGAGGDLESGHECLGWVVRCRRCLEVAGRLSLPCHYQAGEGAADVDAYLVYGSLLVNPSNLSLVQGGKGALTRSPYPSTVACPKVVTKRFGAAGWPLRRIHPLTEQLKLAEFVGKRPQQHPLEPGVSVGFQLFGALLGRAHQDALL